MKRFYKCLLLFILVLTVVGSLFVGCKQTPEHVHTFSESWSSDAGSHWHAATCEHKDLKSDYSAHAWGDPVVTKEATCSEKGEKVLTCTVCGATKTEEIPTLPHTWGEAEVTKEPTCLENGEKIKTCSVCSATGKEVIPATGHSFSKEWSNDDFYHWQMSTCEHSGLKGSFEPHTWDSLQIIKPSSCDEEGIVRYTCKCGVYKDESIPKHTFATTWTSDADYHWHEATCPDKDLVVPEKAEHVWNSGASKTDGSVVFTCTVCGKQKTVKPSSGDVSMITAGPGENSSNQAVISWHSTSTGSFLEYTDADGEEFVHVIANAQCNEVLSEVDWKDTKGKTLSSNHYRCKVYLENLTPGSTYKYRIKYSGDASEVAEFKTAEADTTYFQFAWMSDLHTPKGDETYINRVAEIIDYAEAKDGVDLDFVLFTGDIVNKGQIYRHWKYWSDSGLLNDYTYAFVCGNHDYYGWNDKERTINDFYKEVCAYPSNNTEGEAFVLDSNYWFIWNRVLFVCIDNFTQESEKLKPLPGSSLEEQQDWFKAVVEANEGNYDYLIYCQHLPFFNTDTKPCDYGNFTSWYKIFDKYKVDFALSSDEHHYRRTYPLYGKKKTDLVDGKVASGTVYVTSNQTEGGSLSSLKNEAASGLKYIEYSAGGQGGVYFTVTPTEMTLHQIGSGGREFDTITVLKKDRSK